MIFPISHERTTVRRLPWVTFSILAACLVVFVLSPRGGPAMEEPSKRHLEVLEFFLEHPYLELDPRVLPPAMLEEIVAAAAPADDAPVDLLQKKLDRLTAEWLESLKSYPMRRWGFVPNDPTLSGLLLHFFVHAGWLHLLFNLLYLYLTAPFVEDAWGRVPFALFYLLSGIAVALLYMWRYGDSFIPLVGASGAIAAVMGAFVVLHGRTKIDFFYWLGILVGTFSAPAWLMFGLWFAGEMISAQLQDNVTGGQAVGGVAYWAHIWGFALGVATAWALRLLKFSGAKASEPGPLGSEILSTSRSAERKGQTGEAWQMLEDTLVANPWDDRVRDAYWRLAQKLEREDKAAQVITTPVRTALRDGAAPEALRLWQEIDQSLPDLVRSPSLLTSLAENAQRLKKKEWARELTQEAFRVSHRATPAGTLYRLLRLSQGRDDELYQRVHQLLLAHPKLDPETRLKLEAEPPTSVPTQPDGLPIPPPWTPD
ncbi:MAG: rhomboid family intramembrane serine protease [Deltaproteobacteria bacterium]|nr:rhomboid family intramembrane serine protease [Deltaproteobacteria bacterium]